MFRRNDLEELAAFEGNHPVVSLYLNMAPSMRGRVTPDAYRTRLKGLIKEAAGRAPKQDIETIEEFFGNEFDWVGRSVAVFCGQEDGLWQVERFAVPIRSTIHVGSKPFIMPLAHVLDNYGSFAVAVVDSQTMRLFYAHLGEIVASEKFEGASVQRIKAGSGSAAGRSRGDHLDDHTSQVVRSNIKQFASKLANFCKTHNAEHVLLGGTETTIMHLKDTLPQVWKDRIEDTFSIAMKASEAEILDEAMEAMQQAEQDRETKLVERVKSLAAQGSTGVLGYEATLEAVEQGRVDKLVLAEGVLSAEQADAAIGKAVDFGGIVEFVDGGSELAKHDGIGALLRY